MSSLFSSFKLGPVELSNRIVVSPMCQYSADDGSMTDWHMAHLGMLSNCGAGLVIVEATHVERHGRITHGCVGLYSDANEYAMGQVLAAARSVALPGTKFGIQIGHAGRKASANRPWEGDDHIAEGDPRGWPTLSPSALAFGGPLGKVPAAMTLDVYAGLFPDDLDAVGRSLDGLVPEMCHLGGVDVDKHDAPASTRVENRGKR